ncbi:DUF294 nucleotidyltransferase-like domain-containing protein [Aestuariimicrobium sp. Y1814]|uniref:DUF294 nucleotidyltransferase-like domain-containing protein n=1 Tax=Aestuariimicrobium sp. Y1814 TaxID=3418742 RepID=UPI003DA74BE5
MDIEVREVRDFLAAHAPWDHLPAGRLDALAGTAVLRYYRRGTLIYGSGDPNSNVHVVRSGGVDLTDASGGLVERLGPGGIFGVQSVLSTETSPLLVRAIEDTLVVVIDSEGFRALAEQDDAFGAYFRATAAHRLAGAAQRAKQSRTGEVSLGRRVGALVTRRPVQAESTISIREAAQVMSAHKVSALLLVDDNRLVGIVTDRDLRSKVVAVGRSGDEPVSAVMTRDLITIEPEARAFEAMLIMTSKGIHHLPVTQGDQVLGLVSSGDMMRLDRAHPIYLAADIARQHDAEGVARVCARIPRLVAEYIEADASAAEISRLLGSISDAATSTLIGLAEAEFGPAPTVDGVPVAWAWVALGSQARHEGRLGSDQDHCIVLDDAADHLSEQGRAWFTRVAERVVEGLEAAGFPRCRGEVMATKWCFTSSQWRRQISHWLNEPDGLEVLHAQIFFDARAVHGRHALVDDLLGWLATQTPGATRFLTHLAAQAVAYTPPLGFFKGFVLEHGGEHADTLDLKAASHAIIQLARVHALALGSTETATDARLRLAAGAGRLDERQAAALVDAAEFIQHLRLHHQAEELRRGATPDNHLDPKTLNALDQRTLREAFTVIGRALKSLAHLHQTHLV